MSAKTNITKALEDVVGALGQVDTIDAIRFKIVETIAAISAVNLRTMAQLKAITGQIETATISQVPYIEFTLALYRYPVVTLGG